MALAQHYYGTAPGGDSAPDLDALLELVARGRPAWMADALCREYPSVTWFPDVGQSAAPARTVCGRCAVQAECAAYGASEPAGVWGGLSRRGRSGANVGRVVSDGSPARLREVGLVETRLPTPTPSPPAHQPGATRLVPVQISVPPRSKPGAHRAGDLVPPNDGERPPAPASCARCPMAVKKGKTLCKGCERRP